MARGQSGTSKKSKLPPKVTTDQVFPITLTVKNFLLGTEPDSSTKVWETKTIYIHPERDIDHV